MIFKHGLSILRNKIKFLVPPILLVSITIIGGYLFYDKLPYKVRKMTIQIQRGREESKSLNVLTQPKKYSAAKIAQNLKKLHSRNNKKSIKFAEKFVYSKNLGLQKESLKVIVSSGTKEDIANISGKIFALIDENAFFIKEVILVSQKNKSSVDLLLDLKKLEDIKIDDHIAILGQLHKHEYHRKEIEEQLWDFYQSSSFKTSQSALIQLSSIAPEMPKIINIHQDNIAQMKPGYEYSLVHLAQIKHPWLKENFDKLLRQNKGRKVTLSLIKIIPLFCPQNVKAHLLKLLKTSQDFMIKRESLIAYLYYESSNLEPVKTHIKKDFYLTVEGRDRLLNIIEDNFKRHPASSHKCQLPSS